MLCFMKLRGCFFWSILYTWVHFIYLLKELVVELLTLSLEALLILRLSALTAKFTSPAHLVSASATEDRHHSLGIYIIPQGRVIQLKIRKKVFPELSWVYIPRLFLLWRRKSPALTVCTCASFRQLSRDLEILKRLGTREDWVGLDTLLFMKCSLSLV